MFEHAITGKRVIGCPRGMQCPNKSGTIHCPGVDDPEGCPMLSTSDPDAQEDAFTPTEMKHAIQMSLSRALKTVVKEVAMDTIDKSIPGTGKFLNRKLDEREQRKKQQDALTQLLKWERNERNKRTLLGGGKVTLERREELTPYLGDDNSWPTGQPIAALAIGI